MQDTGSNIQESIETLLVQQGRLLAGKRPVQMFPNGTPELPVPDGMKRVTNHRGVFHYNPVQISEKEVLELSLYGYENRFLELGPFSKPEITTRLAHGEEFVVITEYTTGGVEVRTAAGTNKTVATQKEYFERTKEAGNVIVCGALPLRVQNKLKEMANA
jgi:hypothetical protein